MPNWSTNALSWEGATQEQENEINELMTRDYEDDDGPLNQIVPMPTEFKDGEDEDDWSAENWGTKWDIDTSSYNSWHHFQTPWGPPTPVILELSKKYPEVVFTMESEYEGCLVLGRIIIKNGSIESNKEFDLDDWSYGVSSDNEMTYFSSNTAKYFEKITGFSLEMFARRVSYTDDFKILGDFGSGLEVMNRLRAIFDRDEEEGLFDQFTQVDPSWIKQMKSNLMLMKAIEGINYE